MTFNKATAAAIATVQTANKPLFRERDEGYFSYLKALLVKH
nr:MAG TPA: hypothetical protein [Caudoviricetes sp.]